MSTKWGWARFGDFLHPNSRPYTLGAEEDANLVGMRLYGAGPFHRELKPAMQIAKKTHFVIKLGDIIYNKLFAWKGTFGIVPRGLDGMFVSDKFPTYELDRERVDENWLRWYFRCPVLWEEARTMSTGSAALSKLTLNPPKFLLLTMPLPPLDEQRRIVARVEALSAKIEEARSLRAQAAEGVRGFVASLHVKMAGTRVRRLEQFLELFEEQERVQIGGSYPQVGVRGFGQGLFERSPVEAAHTTYAAFNRLYAGAVVLSQVKGWEGAIAVCPSSLAGRYASPEYRTFRCISGEAEPEYVAPLFASPWFWSRLSDLTRGVGARRERVRPELFLRMEIPMPRIEDQRRALPLLDNLGNVAKCQAETAPELDALLPSILDRAFKGEL
ncbi:MAG TPA: hypothetical protein VG206_04410 [Terriglobia bacterium]|nr:hypothetical protein [Terriglobia bacterium]